MIEFISEHILILIALAVTFYYTWNLGINDSANAIGAPIGGRLISFRRGVILLILFVLLGAVLESWEVMETVGEGIVIIPEGAGEYGGQNPLNLLPQMAIIALFSASAWFTLANYLKIPVSGSHSIVGAVIGVGAFLSTGPLPGEITEMVAEISVDLSVVSDIVLAWIITPVGSAILAFIIYYSVTKILRKIHSPTTLNKIFRYATILAGGFVAFSIGANSVGNATGLILAVTDGASGSALMSPPMIGLFGGTAVCVGILTYGRRVVKTVGEEITSLKPNTAFAAQIGAALTVWIFARIGIPVSTSTAIVGGVAGVGMVKGTSAVSKGKIGKIVLTWILTPTIAALLAFGLSWIIMGA